MPPVNNRAIRAENLVTFAWPRETRAEGQTDRQTIQGTDTLITIFRTLPRGRVAAKLGYEIQRYTANQTCLRMNYVTSLQ